MRRLVDSLLLVLVVYSVTWPVLRGFGAADEGLPPGGAESPRAQVIAAGEEAAEGSHVVALFGAVPGGHYEVVVETCEARCSVTGTACDKGRLRIAVPAQAFCHSGSVTVLNAQGERIAHAMLQSGPHTVVSL